MMDRMRALHHHTEMTVLEQLMFDLPDRLSKSLRVSGVGVAEMAEYLGVSRATIANWTSGRTVPNTGAQRAWALRTDVPFEWLSKGILPTPEAEADIKKSFLPESNRRPSHYKLAELLCTSRLRLVL